MDLQFITDVLTVEVELIKPFAREILKMFEDSPSTNNITMDADTVIQEHEVVARQMWLLRQILIGQYLMMTSYDLSKKNGTFSVKVRVSRVPEKSRKLHDELIADIHAQAEKAKQQ